MVRFDRQDNMNINKDTSINHPVIILGAARSGTKILRATIASSSDFVCIPYDINYVWKYKNYHVNHDELIPDNLNNKIIEYIHKQFFRIIKNKKNKKMVEKTVSNSLRVDFVKKVFPDCKFIHIIRDGRDVAESSRRCWDAPLELNYLIKKALNFPLKDAPKYAIQFIKYNLNKFAFSKKKIKSWGPRFNGIDDIVKTHSLIELCGIQWLRCVESTLKSLEKLSRDEYIQIKYEDLVQNPTKELRKIANFLEIRDFYSIKKFADKEIKSDNVGKWKKTLSEEEKRLLIPHIQSMLKRFNYLI